MGKDFKSSNPNNKQRPNRGVQKSRNNRGNRGGIGSKKYTKPKTTITNHRLEGIFILKTGKEESLVTLNLNPGESVYGEKRVSIEEQVSLPDGTNTQPKKNRISYMEYISFKIRSSNNKWNRKYIYETRIKSSLFRSSKWYYNITCK
jgi:hypothetical protein